MTIGNGVTTIGQAAFYGCTGLTSITVDAANNAYSSLGGVLFNKTQTILLTFPAGRAGSYTIGNGVTTIGEEAFSSCTGLTSVTIGNSVAIIGGGAFSSCTGLTSVTMGNSVTSIGLGAFYYCTGLRSVYFQGNAPTSVGWTCSSAPTIPPCIT